MNNNDTQGGVDTISRDDVELAKPRMYKVLLLNDDYTTMDFVVTILEGIFKKSPAEATQIMLQVHKEGYGIAGIYPKQIAETKILIVHERARAEGHPLKCLMEPE